MTLHKLHTGGNNNNKLLVHQGTALLQLSLLDCSQGQGDLLRVFGEYAEAWLAWRPISGRTRDHYARLLRTHILPTFGGIDLRDINPAAVEVWFGSAAASTPPTVRTHAYSLMRRISASALAEGLIDSDPCGNTSLSTSDQAAQVRPATAEEVNRRGDAGGLPGPHSDGRVVGHAV